MGEIEDAGARQRLLADYKTRVQHGAERVMAWFQQAPRPGFTKATVSAWRVSLEERRLGSSSIIIRMSAIRKLAAEAADNGLLAPELAPGHQPREEREIDRHSKDDFRYVFEKAFEGLVIDRMEGNEEIFGKLMADGEFRRLAVEHLLHKVYGALKKTETD